MGLALFSALVHRLTMASMWRSKLGAEYQRELINQLDAKHLSVLKQMRSEPQNAHCADCKRSNNTWASVNLGVFLCDHCADIHRALGSHISKVKACHGTDLWGPDEIVRMQELNFVLPNKESYHSAQDAEKMRKEDLMELCLKKYGWKTWACENAHAGRKEGVPSQSPRKSVLPLSSPATLPSVLDAQKKPGKVAGNDVVKCTSYLQKEQPNFSFDDFFDDCIKPSKLETEAQTDVKEANRANNAKLSSDHDHADVHSLFEACASPMAPPSIYLKRASTDDIWEGFEDW